MGKYDYTLSDVEKHLDDATSYSDLLTRVTGNKNHSSYYLDKLKNQLKEWGATTVHFKKRKGGRTWTDKDLSKAVEDSICIADVLRALDLTIVSSNYVTMRKHILRLKLDTSHFIKPIVDENKQRSPDFDVF